MEIKNLKLSNVEIQNLTQRTIAIIGGKGSGKTQTLKMLAVSIPDDIPTYIFDPLNIIRIEGFTKLIVSRHAMKKADKDKKDDDVGDDLGKLYAQTIPRLKEKKIIFGFESMLQEEMVRFCNSFFKFWHPENCMILFDEIHEFTPERGMGMEYSEEIERGFRHWRNSNVGFIMNTQRASFTSKKVLGLTDFLILYRITYTNDVEAAKDLIKNMLSKEDTDAVISKVQTKGFLEGYTINFIP